MKARELIAFFALWIVGLLIVNIFIKLNFTSATIVAVVFLVACLISDALTGDKEEIAK